MPKYKVNGRTFNIPDNEVDLFEADFPEAQLHYQTNDGRKFTIYANERKDFLSDFPDATELGWSETIKEQAKEILRKEFGKKLFVPSSFLKAASLDKMEGDYVPFFLYDFDCKYRFAAKGKKIRKWRSGNTEYTETSIFQIYRDMDVDFSRIWSYIKIQ